MDSVADSSGADREELLAALKALMKENVRLTQTLEAVLYGDPPMMSTPDGLLPVNSRGMRHAVDQWVALRRELGID